MILKKLRDLLAPRPFKNLSADELVVSIAKTKEEIDKDIRIGCPLLANSTKEKLYYLEQELIRKKK